MKKERVLGKSMMLFLQGKAIACATSCKLDISAELMETTSKDDGMWKNKEVKSMSYNGSSDCLLIKKDADHPEQSHDYDNLMAAILAGEPLDFRFTKVESSKDGVPSSGWELPSGGYSGQVFLTSLSITAQDGDYATCSVSYDGSGALIPTPQQP